MVPGSFLVLTPDELQDFAGSGMPAEREFREDHHTVNTDFERSSRAMDQFDRRVGELRLDLGRQTGGPGLGVSNHTILNSDLHHGSR